jgi:hypothetical protein
MNMAKIICLSCFRELEQEENIFSCSKKHHFCAACGKSMHLQCEVGMAEKKIFFLLLRFQKPLKFDYFLVMGGSIDKV